MGKLKTNRIGEQVINKYGRKLTIIEYKDYDHIVIEVDDVCKTKIRTRYKIFSNGCYIASPYDKTIHNTGYIGIGEYNITNNRCAYNKWSDMIYRCYDPYFLNNKTYIDCTVCDEWLNFQNFAKWYEENYYECNNGKMCLDKDILVKGNKIYSPDTCVFVPHEINMLFVKADKIRGDLPIGVVFDKDRDLYTAKISIKNKIKFLGRYNTREEAFLVYKQFKENYIKQVAEEYVKLIPNKLYKAMCEWKVEMYD